MPAWGGAHSARSQTLHSEMVGSSAAQAEAEAAKAAADAEEGEEVEKFDPAYFDDKQLKIEERMERLTLRLERLQVEHQTLEQQHKLYSELTAEFKSQQFELATVGEEPAAVGLTSRPDDYATQLVQARCLCSISSAPRELCPIATGWPAALTALAARGCSVVCTHKGVGRGCGTRSGAPPGVQVCAAARARPSLATLLTCSHLRGQPTGGGRRGRRITSRGGHRRRARRGSCSRRSSRWCGASRPSRCRTRTPRGKRSEPLVRGGTRVRGGPQAWLVVVSAGAHQWLALTARVRMARSATVTTLCSGCLSASF